MESIIGSGLIITYVVLSWYSEKRKIARIERDHEERIKEYRELLHTVSKELVDARIKLVNLTKIHKN